MIDIWQKVGIVLAGAGFVLIFLLTATLPLFSHYSAPIITNNGSFLVTIGNLVFLLGLVFVIGPRMAINFFSIGLKTWRKGVWFGGMAVGFLGSPKLGLTLESCGFIMIFGGATLTIFCHPSNWNFISLVDIVAERVREIVEQDVNVGRLVLVGSPEVDAGGKRVDDRLLVAEIASEIKIDPDEIGDVFRTGQPSEDRTRLTVIVFNHEAPRAKFTKGFLGVRSKFAGLKDAFVCSDLPAEILE